MLRTRIIPVLLLRDWGLEKSIRFRDPVYVGSPINAARVFNGYNVDELILLDIVAGQQGRGPILEIVSQIAEEAFMPITVGGGLRDCAMIRDLLQAGADRVVLNSITAEHPALVREAADRFGSQCIVVSIDVRRRAAGSLVGACEVVVRGGRQSTGLDAVAHARRMAELGAGEIFLTSIDRDGTMSGYDVELIRAVSDAVPIPVIACGGAGRVEHLAEAVSEGHASAVAAGAFFLFFGPRRTVLITYPSDAELAAWFPLSAIRAKAENPTVLPPGTATG